MKLFGLLSLSLLGIVTFFVSWLGWQSLLYALAGACPDYSEYLLSPELQRVGILLGLLLTVLPYYAYSLRLNDLSPNCSLGLRGSRNTRSHFVTPEPVESIWSFFSPKGIALQILVGIMILPVAIMLQVGFLLLPHIIFNGWASRGLQEFIIAVSQSYGLALEYATYLVLITPSLISAGLFYLMKGPQWLSIPRGFGVKGSKEPKDSSSPMPKPDRAYVSQSIKDFLCDEGTNYAWDDLLATPRENKTYQDVCSYLQDTHWLYPSNFGWCNDKGVKKLGELADMLNSPADDEEIRSFLKAEILAAK